MGTGSGGVSRQGRLVTWQVRSTVRYLRTEKGWTQAQLAEHADLGTKVIHSIEKGNSLDSRNLAKVAEAFDLPLSRLIAAAEQLEDAQAPLRELLEIGADMVETALPTLGKLNNPK